MPSIKYEPSLNSANNNTTLTSSSLTMAAPQFERDLRSANKEWRRTKDSTVKWSHGSRHLYGIRRNIWGDVIEEDLALCSKSRPEKRPSEIGHASYKPTPNLHKPRRNGYYNLPNNARRRALMNANDEILRDHPHPISSSSITTATSPLPSPYNPLLSQTSTDTNPAAEAATEADPFLYSFDRTDSPGAPLTLEVFVKQPTAATAGRETEKLVEREYEVLDGNGEAVRGRRARAVLRRAGEGSGKGENGEGGEVDEGFELL